MCDMLSLQNGCASIPDNVASVKEPFDVGIFKTLQKKGLRRTQLKWSVCWKRWKRDAGFGSDAFRSSSPSGEDSALQKIPDSVWRRFVLSDQFLTFFTSRLLMRLYDANTLKQRGATTAAPGTAGPIKPSALRQGIPRWQPRSSDQLGHHLDELGLPDPNGPLPPEVAGLYISRRGWWQTESY